MTTPLAPTTVTPTAAADAPADVRRLMLDAFLDTKGASLVGTEDGFYIDLPLPSGGMARFWEPAFAALARLFADLNNRSISALSAEDGVHIGFLGAKLAMQCEGAD